VTQSGVSGVKLEAADIASAKAAVDGPATRFEYDVTRTPNDCIDT
jgi:hypothetical protein